MSSYAEIYTQNGLNNMILECESKNNRLHRERKDVSEYWTEYQIGNHERMIDEEIVETIGVLKELRDALQYRIRNNLR